MYLNVLCSFRSANDKLNILRWKVVNKSGQIEAPFLFTKVDGFDLNELDKVLKHFEIWKIMDGEGVVLQLSS